MPDDGDAPGPAQESLSGTAAHVGHIRVVDRKPKDPAEAKGGRPRYHQPSGRNISRTRTGLKHSDLKNLVFI